MVRVYDNGSLQKLLDSMVETDVSESATGRKRFSRCCHGGEAGPSWILSFLLITKHGGNVLAPSALIVLNFRRRNSGS